MQYLRSSETGTGDSLELGLRRRYQKDEQGRNERNRTVSGSHRASHLGSRVRGIIAFSKTGATTADKLKLMIAGYARGHNFGGRDLIGRIGRKLFPEISARLTLPGKPKLSVNLCDLSQLSVAEEIFVERVYDLERIPFAPDLILDCGAHTGMFTLLASSKFPNVKIVAFEPDPENSRWLRRQVSENRLPVEIVQAAVATSNGEVLFNAGHGCGSSISIKPAESPNAIRVKTVNLADYLSPNINLVLKIDIEGSEEILLPGIAAFLPTKTYIFLETHGGRQSWDRLSQLLIERGFTTNVTRCRETYTDGTAIRTEPMKASGHQ